MTNDEISEDEIRSFCANNLRVLAQRLEKGELKVTKFVHAKDYERRASMFDSTEDGFVAGKTKVIIEYE